MEVRQGENDLTELLADLQQWELWSNIALNQRDHARRKMVEEMRAADFSYRETAEVMGISHQRVSQLSGDSRGTPESCESKGGSLLREHHETLVSAEEKIRVLLRDVLGPRGPAMVHPIGFPVGAHDAGKASSVFRESILANFISALDVAFHSPSASAIELLHSVARVIDEIADHSAEEACDGDSVSDEVRSASGCA